jgi:hypothetical protein
MRRYTRPFVVSFTALFFAAGFFEVGFLAVVVLAPSDRFAALAGAAFAVADVRAPRVPRRGACAEAPSAAATRTPRRGLGVPAVVGCASLAAAASATLVGAGEAATSSAGTDAGASVVAAIGVAAEM